jgi:hypothetical protein
MLRRAWTSKRPVRRKHLTLIGPPGLQVRAFQKPFQRLQPNFHFAPEFETWILRHMDAEGPAARKKKGLSNSEADAKEG